MPVIDLPIRSVNRIVDHYVESRKSLDWPISTAQAVRTIRYLLPQCPLTDRQLADMVASSAIARHRNLAFDIEPVIAALDQAVIEPRTMV